MITIFIAVVAAAVPSIVSVGLAALFGGTCRSTMVVVVVIIRSRNAVIQRARCLGIIDHLVGLAPM